MNLYNKTERRIAMFKDRLLQIMIFIVVLIVIAFFIFSLEFSHPQDSVKVSPERILRIQTTQPVWLVELRYFWNAYKEFCYSDSQLIKFNLYRGFENDTLYSKSSEYDCDLGINSNFIGQRNIWIHKQFDFQGFMDWLEEKDKD